MKGLSVLIKPSSSSCNMRCKYCFYHDEAQNRKIKSFGFMSDSTAEILIKRAIEADGDYVNFVFQGGEPTLIGLDFFRFFVDAVRRHNNRKKTVAFALQTNGTLVSKEWAEFFRENDFLVGLSLDGTKDINDKYRVDASGKGSFSKVMRAAQLFDAHGVEYNILTTVTANVAKHPEKIYRFFYKNNFRYQQYIACLNPIGDARRDDDFSLTPQLYGSFLNKLFDLWYADFIRGDYVSIRFFDNLLYMLCGNPPEACGMTGYCTYQYVIEADGSVYPCDFYVLDEYKLGNVTADNFSDFDKKRREIGFIEKSLTVAVECKTCEYMPLCRGGCRRERDDFDGGELKRNRLCAAYKSFFSHALPGLKKAAFIVKNKNPR